MKESDRAEGPVTFAPIGYVENDFDAPATPEAIAATESRVVVAAELVEGLTGLEAGQRVMIVFHFHLVQSYDLLQHPRGIALAQGKACSPCTRPVVPIPSG